MNKTILTSAVVGVLALSGAISVANASPVLQIITTEGSRTGTCRRSERQRLSVAGWPWCWSGYAME